MTKRPCFIMAAAMAAAVIQPLPAERREEKVRSYWLGEDFTCQVYVPDTPRGEEPGRYPVIYVLDGDRFFDLTVGYFRAMEGAADGFHPRSIIVGLTSHDPARDFAPAEPVADPADATRLPEGSEMFHKFMMTELRPLIEASCPADGTCILAGHSEAALFTLSTMIYHPEAYNSYIAIDPALWSASAAGATESCRKAAARGKYDGCLLYMAIPDSGNPHASLCDDFISSVALRAPGLRTFSRHYTDENHTTVVIPALYDGLRTIARNR